MRYLIASILVMILCACSSAKKRGEEALVEGNYEQAVAHYEQAHAQDPRDPEVQNGLKRAREEFIGQKLIQVRLARQASNMPEALDHFLWVLEKERAWQLAPGGKIGFTQEEEANFLRIHLKQTLETEIQAGYPLKAEIQFRKAQPVLTSAESTLITRKIQKAGKKHCQTLARDALAGRSYYASWLAGYCQFWGERPMAAKLDSQVPKELSSGIQVTYKDGQLSQEFQGMLKQALDQSFTQTPWYDPRSRRTALISVTGNFSESRTKNGVVLLKTYSESEEYVEHVSVQRERIRTDADGKPVTESYWTTEPQTRTRSVNRDYRYPAWKHEQKLTLQLAGDLDLFGKKLHGALAEQSEVSGIEHDENQPKIGLNPERPNLPQPGEWARSNFIRFADSIRVQANQLWNDHFCQPDPAAKTLADTGNRVAQCLRLRGAAPVFAEEWYRKTLGVGLTEGQQLLDSQAKKG